MLIDTFKHEFKQRAGVFITRDVILFRRPLELYDYVNDEVIQTFGGRELDAVLDYSIGGKLIRDIIARWTRMPVVVLNGGRGGSSGMDAYTHRGIPMGGGAGAGSGFSGNDLPARFNAQFGNEASFNKALDAFRKAHVNDNFESGITVDSNGFITSYVHGTAGAVQIAGGKGEHVIHNHPVNGWPIFSGADLISSALEPASGITASSTRVGRTPETAKYAGDYIFNKGHNFNAEAFVRGVKGAYLKGKDYNDAVDRWLKDHQKKYGYTYTYVPDKAKASTKSVSTGKSGKRTKAAPNPEIYGVQLSFFD